MQAQYARAYVSCPLRCIWEQSPAGGISGRERLVARPRAAARSDLDAEDGAYAELEAGTDALPGDASGSSPSTPTRAARTGQGGRPFIRYRPSVPHHRRPVSCLMLGAGRTCTDQIKDVSPIGCRRRLSCSEPVSGSGVGGGHLGSSGDHGQGKYAYDDEVARPVPLRHVGNREFRLGYGDLERAEVIRRAGRASPRRASR